MVVVTSSVVLVIVFTVMVAVAAVAMMMPVSPFAAPGAGTVAGSAARAVGHPAPAGFGGRASGRVVRTGADQVDQRDPAFGYSRSLDQSSRPSARVGRT